MHVDVIVMHLKLSFLSRQNIKVIPFWNIQKYNILKMKASVFQAEVKVENVSVSKSMLTCKHLNTRALSSQRI